MRLEARANPPLPSAQPVDDSAMLAPQGLRVSTLASASRELMLLSYPFARPAFLERLSDGEVAVVLLALAGHGNAEIARIRAASSRTVANQLAAAYRKLGGASRARLAAVELAGERGPARALDPWRELIEVVYWPEASAKSWLRRLVEAVRPAFDQGLGVAGWTVHMDVRGGAIQDVANGGVAESVLERLLAAAREAPDFVNTFHGREFSSLQGHLCARDSAAWQGLRIIRGCGARDLVALIARGGQRAIALGALVPAGWRVSTADHGHYARVVEHLAAGLRLRERADDGASSLGSDQVAASERAALREAAIVAHASPDAEQVTSVGEVWSAFVQGRLRMRDRFDSAGRRFLIAEVPLDDAKRALSARQLRILSMRSAGQSLKEIAHQLHMSIPTVSLDLSKALGALGLRHVHELRN